MSLSGNNRPLVGITWSPYLTNYLAKKPDLVDFVEISFEQVRHGTDYTSINAPLILHCASLSLAGFVPPDSTLINEVKETAASVDTPWIGEHLAYVSGESLDPPGKTITSAFTLCPQLSAETANLVADNWQTLQPQIPTPLILENPPQYFKMPGSKMTMAEFIYDICDRCEADILLDISHWHISSDNLDLDPYREAEKLPWERIIELHIAGSRSYAGLLWDDHGSEACQEIWSLLDFAFARCSPKAVTFEYNWLTHYSPEFFPHQITRLHELIEKSGVTYENS
jgi:uncharacterized protein (UPF0276 family)